MSNEKNNAEQPHADVDLSRAAPSVTGVHPIRAGANIQSYRQATIDMLIRRYTNPNLIKASIPPTPVPQLHPTINFLNNSFALPLPSHSSNAREQLIAP